MTPLSTLDGIAREFTKFRRRVYALIIACFVLWFAATVFVVVGYVSSQDDFHRGSCTSRLVLRSLLNRALQNTEATPISPQLSPEQKAGSLDYFRDGIKQIDVSDCGDVKLPDVNTPPPPPS